MIDDDVVASKRRIRLIKLAPFFYITLYFCIFIGPLGWVVVSEAGAVGVGALVLAACLSIFLLVAIFRRGTSLVSMATGAVPADPHIYRELESMS